MKRLAAIFLALALIAGAPPRERIEAWDTGKPSESALDTKAFAARSGWKAIDQGTGGATVRGDAVFTNGRVLAVLRKETSELDLYAVTKEGIARRATVTPQRKNGIAAGSLEKTVVTDRTRSTVQVKATFRSKKGTRTEVQFRLKRGEVLLEVSPGTGAESLRVKCSGRFALLPDFFADDIVLDARAMPSKNVDVPSEHFILQPTADGDSIVMCVFENREQEVRLTLDGKGTERMITGSKIRFGKGRKIWVALLEGKGTWHTKDLEATDGKKILPAGWSMPFPAQWHRSTPSTHSA